MRAAARFFCVSRIRLFIVGFLLLTTYYLLPATIPVASAQSAAAYLAPNTNADVPQNLHTFSQSIMIDVMSSMVCQLTGVDVVNKKQACLGADPATGKIGFVKNGGGALGIMTNMIVATYSPPIQSGEYYRYMASNFGLAKHAYAASYCEANGAGYNTGFCSLSPLFVLWDRFKNLVYLIFIILFVLIGLAIMLRVKVDQKATMSIENQIPKIIIALLLISFTMPIAGLLIDGMWVLTYVTINMVNPTSTTQAYNSASLQANFFSPPMGVVNELYNVNNIKTDPNGSSNKQGFGGVLNIAITTGQVAQHTISSMFAPQSLGQILTPIVDPNNPVLQSGNQGCGAFDIACNISKIIGGAAQATGQVVGGLLSAIVGWLISWVVGIMAVLVVVIALLFAMFRLWMELIKAYIFLLVDIVLSPFWVAIGLFPGAPISFEKWIREMLSNLLPFPAVAGMLLLGKSFMETFAAGEVNGHVFIPPFIGNPIGDGNLKPIGAFIGLGIILLTPQILDMVKDLIKPPPFKYTPGILQPLEAGAAPVTGAVGGAIAKTFKVDYTGKAIGVGAQAIIKQSEKIPRLGGLVRFGMGVHGVDANNPYGGGHGGPPPHHS